MKVKIAPLYHAYNIAISIFAHCIGYLLSWYQSDWGILQAVSYSSRQLGEPYNSEFYTDNFFYKLRIHVYVIIESKATLFKPEYTVQLTICTNVMDKTLYDEYDGKSSVCFSAMIAIRLCFSMHSLTMTSQLVWVITNIRRLFLKI